jgi:hypothetical protein
MSLGNADRASFHASVAFGLLRCAPGPSHRTTQGIVNGAGRIVSTQLVSKPSTEPV